MKLKRIAALFCIGILPFSMTGCWNYRELETLGLVAGFSVDRGAGGIGYHAAFEVLDESGGEGSNGGGQTSIKSQIIETDGSTVFDTVRNALLKADKKLYFGECKVVILSRQLASEGIAPVLDWINRDAEPRLTEDLFVSKEATAAEVLKRKSPTNPVTSYALDKIVQNGSNFLSKAPFMQLYQVNDALGEEGKSLVLPALDIDRTQSDAPPELAGTAVFQKDRLLGFLESDESKFLLFLRNQAKGGLLQVSEGSAVPNITLELQKSDTTVTVLSKGQAPRLAVAVKAEAALGEMETAEDFDSESGVDKLEQDADRTLEDSMRQLIVKAQSEYGSDLFGFGSRIYQNDPQYWKEISPRWNSLFQTLKVEVSASVEIKNTAQAKSNVKVGG